MPTLHWPKFIELETSRLCNRTCAWCPNGQHAERRQQTLMDWDLFESILMELGQHQYAGWLAFHNYNEPLLNPRLLRELHAARRWLPEAHPCIFTNGDPLTRLRLEALGEAGVDYVRVTRYPAGPEAGPHPERLGRWFRAQKLDDLPWTTQPVRQGLARVTMLGQMRVEVISPDLQRYNYRGGTATALVAVQRTEPCWMTTHTASIDYRGRLKMCCNVFPAAPAHEAYVVGTLGQATFETLWRSATMDTWRRTQLQADWSHSPICAGCSQNLRDRKPHQPGGGPG